MFPTCMMCEWVVACASLHLFGRFGHVMAAVVLIFCGVFGFTGFGADASVALAKVVHVSMTCFFSSLLHEF